MATYPQSRSSLKQATSSKKESGRSWFLVLFALPFAGVGIGFLVMSVIPTLYDWGRMQSWQPAQAVLSQAKLKAHQGDDSTTYSVTATYHYEYAGSAYQGTRVAISSTADNIGSFQENLGRRLERSLNLETPVPVWVNPNNPAEAIIDRSLRLGLLAFEMLFVVAFGGAGIGLLVYQLFYAERAQVNPAVDADKPWLQRHDWAGNRIASQHKTSLWLAWIFAFFWNLISSPILFLFPGEVAKGNYPVLIALLFPLVGCGLLWWAIGLTLDWRRYGELYVNLDPFPGSIGGQVGGTVELRSPHVPARRFLVTLSCIYFYESGSGDDRSTREKLVWQSEGVATTRASSKGTQLQFRFDVPANLPASEPKDYPYHGWRLDLKSSDPASSLARQFEIPVYATADRSRYINHDSASHPEIVESRLEQIDALCRINQISGGVELYFPILRNWKTALSGLVFGLIFAGAGVAAGLAGAPSIFPIAFTGVGGLIIWFSFDALFNSLQVRLDRSGFSSRKCLCGIPVRSQQVHREKLQQLQLRESYSTQSGSDLKTVYKIVLTQASGKDLKVADSLRGEATARQLMESISLYSGIPMQS